MNRPTDEELRRVHELFDREHERLRAELMDSLADGSAESTSSSGRFPGESLGRRLWGSRAVHKLALSVAAGIAIVALVWWMGFGSSSALASEVFANVLEQIRKAHSVTYKSTLELAGRPAQTSQVLFMEPGHERKIIAGKLLQISDYQNGRTLAIDSCCGWSLLVEYTVTAQEKLQASELDRLRRLGKDSGRFVGKEELDGRLVNVFEAQDRNDKLTIWCDRQTDLPVRVKIVTGEQKQGTSAGKATVTLSDFVWNEELDESLFELKAPEGFKQYQIRLLDDSLPLVEKDLIEAFRILTDLSGGAFPASLQAKDLGPILKKLKRPAATVVHTGTGKDLVIGPTFQKTDQKGEPAMLQYLRANQKQMQVSRGTRFVNQLTAQSRPWRYVGNGVQRGQKKRVFWYKPEGTETFRVIYGHLSARDVAPAKKPATERADE